MKKSNLQQFFKKSFSAFIIFLLLFQLLPNTTLITNAENKLHLSSVSSKTKNGYKITMIINNTSNKAVKNWSLKLSKSEFKITSVQKAKATELGNSIIITPNTATKKSEQKGMYKLC